MMAGTGRQSRIAWALIACLAVLRVPAFAADAPPVPQAAPQQPAPAADNGPFTRSFMFSPIDVTAINRALSGAPTGPAILNAGKTAQPIPQRRIIAVSGVVWRSDDDWIVWINGKKVTPKSYLPEIVDIKVDKDSVRLKWFDIGINGIISIGLRPHQTYDIVTGVLLPG
jgi:hypothetical protein